MRSIINLIKENKKVIIGVSISPFVMYSFSVLAVSLFKLGTTLGTFIRHLYFIVVC